MSLLRLGVIALLALAGLAVAKELAQPQGLRVGEGRVLGVPYSMRMLQPADLRQRYWNPEGPVAAPPLLGVGVTPNLPALLRRMGLWQ